MNSLKLLKSLESVSKAHFSSLLTLKLFYVHKKLYTTQKERGKKQKSVTGLLQFSDILRATDLQKQF